MNNSGFMLNVVAFSLTMVICLSGVADNPKQFFEEVCSKCIAKGDVKQKYCGDFEPMVGRWIDGDWMVCPTDVAESPVLNSCTSCFVVPSGSLNSKVRCGLYDFKNYAWVGEQHFYSCKYNLHGGKPKLPLISSSVYLPGISDRQFNPERSAFEPDGLRNLVREQQNILKYGTPYDRTNRRESRYWRNIFGHWVPPNQ